MTNNLQRYVLFAVIAALLFLLLREWSAFSSAYDAKRKQAIVDAAELNASAGLIQNEARLPTSVDMPSDTAANIDSVYNSADESLPTDPGVVSAEPVQNSQAIAASYLTITTNTQRITIDRRGGRIVEVQLLKHLTELGDAGVPLKLIENNALRSYTAFDAIAARSGEKTDNVVFNSDANEYLLQGDQPQSVTLTGSLANDIEVERQFTLDPNDYVIESAISIINRSATPWKGRYYGEIRRDNTQDPGVDDAPLGMRSYLGAATTNTENPYEKINFKDIAKSNYEQKVTGGWIAMIQHYFVTAWVPNQTVENTMYTRLRSAGNRAMNTIGFIGRDQTIAPGQSARFSGAFYAGPKNQYRLGELAENLELTVDYGFLWWLSQPLYALLHMFATGELHAFDKVYHVFSGFQNWGVAIIALTFVVKALFFKLSAASYRSMANMRRVQPKLLALRERHGSDRQAQSKAMMELYQKEKINPLGGCLPILIQMPVFIALYWALIESVELRHAPFALWIKDLSVMDPFFILPILMGVTMWFQTRMNPTPPDPMQAKVMQWMPIIFTFFFLWFPAGLVIYWVTNNILSIAQQWYITRKIENEAAAKA